MRHSDVQMAEPPRPISRRPADAMAGTRPLVAEPGRLAAVVSDLRRGWHAEHWRQMIHDAYQARGPAGVRSRPRYYYRRLIQRLRHIVPPGARVLDIGCGCGHMLAGLRPSLGVGVDLVEAHVRHARRRYPHLRFEHLAAEDAGQLTETFDYVIVSQALGEFYDVVAVMRGLLPRCHDRTRLIIVNYNRLWQPALQLAEWMGIKPPSPPQHWLPVDEIENLLALSGWQTVTRFGLTLCPLPIPVLAGLVNRGFANLPLLQSLCLNHVVVARPVDPSVLPRSPISSVSVVVPARNEAGHIRSLVARLPDLAPQQEVIFVEGHSRDDTWREIHQVVDTYRGPWRMRAVRQEGDGKADAVRTAFRQCTGDVLFILDADLGVPPEELTAFRDVLANGHAEFVNGSRMVYLMDKQAMRFCNLLGNKAFGGIFTYLLAHRFRDTLCGTKVLRRSDYERIAANRAYFGDFDPFGDFDLLFGAARLNLKIVDVPVHYKARTYGRTNISRFRHGLMLLRMCWFAARKMKFV